MKAAFLGTAAALLLAATAASAQSLAERRITVRPHAYAVPPPAGFVSGDELREYRMDQLEGRQDAELRALELRQLAERRAVDPDED